MSDSEKYVPDIGDTVLSNGVEVKVLSVPDSSDCICVLCLGENLHWVVDLKEIRKIPTKADIEREQLIEIISKHRVNCIERAVEIQKAGFTIPKKVKRVSIKEKFNAFSYMLNKQDDNLIDAICKLLKQNGIEVEE